MNRQSNHSEFRNFTPVGIGLLVLVVVGVSGYILLEGWSWFDALYMTFITFSTVGFTEVAPMDADSRLFTIFLILFGLVVLSMFSASVTSLLVRRELLAKFKIKRMKKEIQNLHGHTILCGAGETGKTVIEEFIHARKPLVVIDEQAEVLQRHQEQYENLLAICGDATKDEVLEEANIRKASGLITALSEDTANLFVVLSARSLNPDLEIVARSVDAHTATKLYKAGASHVVSPNITEGKRMASVMLRPTVVNFLDVAMRDQEISLKMEEVLVPPGSRYHGKTLLDMQIPQRTGLIVIAIKKAAGSKKNFIFNPRSSTIVHENDILIVLGDQDHIERLHSHLRAEA